MIVVRPEERDVEVTGAPGYGGDEVDTRGEVRLGVEAGHLATPPSVSPALRADRQRDVKTGLQHQQHLQGQREVMRAIRGGRRREMLFSQSVTELVQKFGNQFDLSQKESS